VKKKTILLLAALPAWYASSVWAETVTLQEAVGRALHGNRQLQAATLEQGAAREGVAVSRSRYLPQVVIESGAVLSNTPSSVFMMKLDEARINPATDFAAATLNHPAARGDFRSAVRLEQPLLDVSVSTGVALAAKDAEAADASLEKTREQIAFRVYLCYLAVRKAAAFRDIADQTLADAREHGRLAEVRERDGVGLKSDRLRAATALAEAEQSLVSAKNDLTLARLRLNLAVGGAEGGALDVAGTPELREPGGEAELQELAQTSRPELKLGQRTVEKGELAVRQAKAAYLPTIYASAGYQLNDRDLPFGVDNDSWSVGVNLRWELFDGTRRSHELKRAELSRQAAATLLEDRRREVTLQVTESTLRRQETRLRLASARAALKAAEETTRLVTLRFRNGLSSMVELMDAESVLNRSRANLVEVENAQLASTGELYFQAGRFVKEVMR